MQIKINSIDFKGSLVNGPGLRSLLFMQGCSRKCDGCHNPSTWDPNGGKTLDVETLADDIKKNCFNNKITITGGEPLDQPDALAELLDRLDGMDVCLYTGYELEDVPESIKCHLAWLKTGPYVASMRTLSTPYIGSTNQKFISLKEEK